jgi:pimeloyl-ACP methyl ester carboxylesterase
MTARGELRIGGSRVVVEGGGPAVVLIHGVGADLHMWDEQAPALARHHTVVRYDTLGHGQTPLPAGEVSLASYAAQVAAVADGLGLARFVLVGFSMGVPISQLYAFDHGDRLAGLVLMNGVYDRSEDQLAAIRGRVAQARADGNFALADAALDRWLSPEFRAARPDVEAKIRKRLADNDPASFITAYDIFAEADPWVVGRLGEIACPTLVTTGENDVGSTPAMSHAMAAAIPGARCHIMPRLRHMPTAEGPEVVNALLLDFLDGLARKVGDWA